MKNCTRPVDDIGLSLNQSKRVILESQPQKEQAHPYMVEPRLDLEPGGENFDLRGLHKPDVQASPGEGHLRYDMSLVLSRAFQ